jgi:serine/threonine-protein kinase
MRGAAVIGAVQAIAELSALWTIRADGSGDAQLVLDDERGIFQGEYSPDGDWLVYRVDTNIPVSRDPDVYAIRPGVDSVGTPLLTSEFLEWEATISPDGQWLAYTSDRSGRFDVYVRPFPDVGSARYPVSTDGGREPLWAKGGSELFFRSASNELVSARFSDSDGTFDVIERTTLFALDGYLSSSGGFRMYDVTTDAQSFVMLRQQGGLDAAVPVLVQNFFEELKRLVPN